MHVKFSVLLTRFKSAAKRRAFIERKLKLWLAAERGKYAAGPAKGDRYCKDCNANNALVFI